MRRFIPLALLLPPLVGCSAGPTSSTPGGNAATGLAVGKIAPRLEGAGVDGKPIKLSDFRGKVVMVDFWATWCGPCRAMIPHEKDLVKRMEGRPFVLLGVSADKAPEKLQQYVEKEKIPWPNIYDGPSSPLARAWKVTGFPTVHLIDANGVIRYFDIEGPDLDKAVEKLVKEAEAG